MAQKHNGKLMQVGSSDEDHRIITKPLAYSYAFYLTGPVEEPESYVEWFDIIRHATERDEVTIHINSTGGLMDTALQFMSSIRECQAHVHCSVEGSCMSAATLIFLAADSMHVAPNSLFMFHNYSGGSFGKGGEMYDNVVFERRWSTELLNQVYEGFLTPNEISSMLDNKDLWLTSEQVVARLMSLVEYKKKKYGQIVGDE